MIYYFNNAGEPYTAFTDTGDEAVAQGIAIKSEVPEGFESWRFSLDPDTNVVTVAYKGMTEEEAQKQKLLKANN